MKYLDLVEMINNKEEYKKEKIYKGMCGVIMSELPISNQWQVIFSDPKTGSDIADICVDEADLKVKIISNFNL